MALHHQAPTGARTSVRREYINQSDTLKKRPDIATDTDSHIGPALDNKIEHLLGHIPVQRQRVPKQNTLSSTSQLTITNHNYFRSVLRILQK